MNNVTLSICLADGRTIELQMSTVEQAILNYRAMKNKIPVYGATYQIEGVAGIHSLDK